MGLSIKKFKDCVNIDMQGINIIDSLQKDYFILVQKETGSWVTLNKSNKEIIDLLVSQRNISLGFFNQNYPTKIETLNSLFESGLLKINGQGIIKENLYEEQCVDTEIYPHIIVAKYTRKCNLRCEYCYAYSTEKENQEMSNDTVLHILQKMINSYGDKEIVLILHGGEPTMRHKNMVELMSSIKNLSKKIDVRIQTNATLITKQIAYFLKKENIGVGISIDGYNQVTNAKRRYHNYKSSLPASLIGLDNLLSVGIKPGLISVITDSNSHKLLEHIDFYVDKGINDFAFNIFFPEGRGQTEKISVDIDDFVSINLELIKKIDRINSNRDRENYVSERNIDNLIYNLSSWNRKFMCAMSPCGAGRKTLGFDTDGSMYPCDDFINQSDFCIGNIFATDNVRETIEKSHIIRKLLNHNVNNITECSVCPWKWICTSHCASNSYFQNGELNKTSYECLYIKKIIPEIIDLLYKNKINHKHFQK